MPEVDQDLDGDAFEESNSVLQKNGLVAEQDKFFNNYPIKAKGRYYYLDFYFPDLKLDLEIDGQQHKRPERKEHDIKRDTFLKENNYQIFRLEWKEITTISGKEFLKFGETWK